MLVFYPCTFRGISVLALLFASTAITAETIMGWNENTTEAIGDGEFHKKDFEWTETYIPYNSNDFDSYGESFQGTPPYEMDDPLRQHLHVYQNPSDKPTPVCFLAHANGARAVDLDGIKEVLSAGYSIISWESVTFLSAENTATCTNDLELVWSWFKANAEAYNFDPESVIVSGRSRGSICSWMFAQSQIPEIKGIYMIDVLPDPAWSPQVKQGPGYVWDQAITVNSPPAHLLFGPECPKPIGQDCVPFPDTMHNPKHGQTLVDKYEELGIGSRIQLTDGLLINSMPAYTLFPDFAASISSSSSSSLGSSADGEGSSLNTVTSSVTAAGSQVDTSSLFEGSSSTTLVGGDSSLDQSAEILSKCSICGYGELTIPDGLVTINHGILVKCDDLDAHTTLITQEACRNIQSMARQSCGCELPQNGSDPDIFTSVNSSNEATSGSQVGTFSPTSLISVRGDSPLTIATASNETTAGSQAGTFPTSINSGGGNSSLTIATSSNEATAGSQAGTFSPTSINLAEGNSSFTFATSSNETTAGSQAGTFLPTSINSAEGNSSLTFATSSNEATAGSQAGTFSPTSINSVGANSSLTLTTSSNEATAGSQMGTFSPTSISSVGRDSSLTAIISSNEATAGSQTINSYPTSDSPLTTGTSSSSVTAAGSQMDTSSASKGSSSISSVGGDSSSITRTSSNEAEAEAAGSGRSFLLDLAIIYICGFCATFGYYKYYERQQSFRDQIEYEKVTTDDGELSMKDMNRDEPENLLLV
jgi:hypothetical protein